MTDRELLRLAAIACGELSGEWRNNEAYFDGVLSRWNPLEDDGDALRLAVNLRISASIVQYVEAWAQFYRCDDHVTGWITMKEPVSDDPYAATRRAIGRAAAEIGRAALAQEQGESDA